MEKLDIFVKRLNKINIQVQLIGNFPWIYLDKVNGNKVKEKFMGNHGFTIGFANKSFSFTDIKYIFEIIRKYK
jgi:hypothetical protein